MSKQLKYYPAVTREDFAVTDRITTLIENGKIFADLGLPKLDPEHDRVMICGSPEMLADTEKLLVSMGFEEGNMSKQALMLSKRLLRNAEPATPVL